jgi:hypothetical protein
LANFEDGEKKIQLVQQFEARVRQELKGFCAPCKTPKVFMIPVDEATSRAELQAFGETPNMLPEEYYLYVLVKVLCEDVFEQASESAADMLFLPMHLPVYSMCGFDLGPSLRASEVLDSPKPKLGVVAWDTYPRAPFVRANPFCPIGQGVLGLSPFYKGCAEWVDESWHLAVTESTIDRHPNDFGLATWPAPFQSQLSAGIGKFLYSFCGVLHYSSMPETHIRGDRFQPLWQALAANPAPDTFVGGLAEAKERFGEAVGYRDFTQNSTFTLCPAGWARWSFRLFESIHDGSIPVILSDYYQLPFDGAVHWSDFSLRLPEASLSDIDTILRALTPAKVAELQRGLERWRPQFDIRGLAANVCREVQRRILPS